MGKSIRNIDKKKEKRRLQKMKKKTKLSISSCSDDTSSTLGSASTPPPTPPSFSKPHHDHIHGAATAQNDLSIYGLDEDVFCYEGDAENEFQLDCGRKLEGDKLIEHLKKCNKRLIVKSKKYQAMFESLQSKYYQNEADNEVKLQRVRRFYRDLIYYSSSRSAIMVKAAIASSS